ncbi:hypothetical protein N7510_007894 [Penicillium lagena]|uniref:uncharacterized protein n=1 Tax=Penicillium lagena TaxID=94218 RepID=UPI002542514D|nr:uncharacterized protein N7510_007894 [Penicillium lagena]KAJ5611175.1 hypothetical protein N7510_007894 [Penicillium lagena]
MQNTNHDKTCKKRRARAACSACNRRKVRCDVTQTGIPCSNCQHEAAVCEVLPRKKHRPRISRVRATEGDHSTLNSTTAEAEILPDDSACSYIGDTRGPRQSVYELCHPRVPQEGHQSPIAPGSSTNTSPVRPQHELDYIHNEGGFAKLPSDVYHELLRCYFYHVHFFFPVVQAPLVLEDYNENENLDKNPLLFWSMMLAATNFIDKEVCQRAGFSSRKAMKKAMYTRAKCFYDLDRGTDKLILIQSVLLMSFWYTDAQDHTGSWHWVGIAITLAQGIGIHRCAETQARHNSQFVPQERQSLTHRLWWTCVIRDRWLSLAKGRPMRIHDEDCDVSLPRSEDVLNELQIIPPEVRHKLIPADADSLAPMWVQLVKISAALGCILRTHYRLKGPKPGTEDIDELTTSLHNCQPDMTTVYDASDTILLHEYHLQLFYQASVTVLCRPYVLNAPASFPINSSAAWQKKMQGRARAAASTTNSIFEKIIELDAVRLIKPMVITSLIPAMQVHLFDCKSSSQLQASLGRNKIQLCMLILDNLRDTYWSAGVMYRLFDRAQRILSNNTGNSSAARQTCGLSSNPEYSQMDQEQEEVATRDAMNGFAALTPNGSGTGMLGDELLPLGSSARSDFSALEQLLSPGFSLSDNQSQVFFADYTSSVMGEGLSLGLYDI